MDHREPARRFGFAIVGAVVGEYLGSARGLGNMIAVAQGTFNPNGIYGAMFILTTVALVAEYLITARWMSRQRVLADSGRRGCLMDAGDEDTERWGR